MRVPKARTEMSDLWHHIDPWGEFGFGSKGCIGAILAAAIGDEHDPRRAGGWFAPWAQDDGYVNDEK